MTQHADLSVSPASLVHLQAEGDMVKQYGLLEEAMIQAGDDHVITALPVSDPGESVTAYSNSRLKVIANRLFLLGYLDRDATPSQLDQTYQAGVKAFQQDAFGEQHLTSDGWVGEETWSALQQLVSFEEPSNLRQWFSDGQPCHALIRAAYLRLYALGLVARAPGHQKRMITLDDLNRALTAFARLGQVLEWQDDFNLNKATFPTLALLFDQDELVARLAAANIPNGVDNKKTIKPFIIGMAKIELWLIGYHIRPKGYAGGSVNSMRGNGLDLKENSQLYKQLALYWKSLGIKSHRINSKSMGLIKTSFPEFFASIFYRLNATDDSEIPDSEHVDQQLKKMQSNEMLKKPKDQKSIVQALWDEVYSIGARIWDGIKRVWHWFKSKVKIVSTVGAFFKNISRIAYQYILKAYEAVQAVIKGVASSILFFAQPVLPLPKEGLNVSAAKVVIGRDKDFDFQVLVDVNDQPGDILKISEYMIEKSGMFALSCRFLGAFLQILVKMLKDIWTFSWVSLLMALLRLYKMIARMAPAFIAAQKREDALSA
ncbi:peptidoglycan-binding protein [Mariprofundus ferrooxydans]|nr:peptidoglycan-binding protein [Mariprofundus ferrooxydans]